MWTREKISPCLADRVNQKKQENSRDRDLEGFEEVNLEADEDQKSIIETSIDHLPGT